MQSYVLLLLLVCVAFGRGHDELDLLQVRNATAWDPEPTPIPTPIPGVPYIIRANHPPEIANAEMSYDYFNNYKADVSFEWADPCAWTLTKEPGYLTGAIDLWRIFSCNGYQMSYDYVSSNPGKVTVETVGIDDCQWLMRVEAEPTWGWVLYARTGALFNYCLSHYDHGRAHPNGMLIEAKSPYQWWDCARVEYIQEFTVSFEWHAIGHIDGGKSISYEVGHIDEGKAISYKVGWSNPPQWSNRPEFARNIISTLSATTTSIITTSVSSALKSEVSTNYEVVGDDPDGTLWQSVATIRNNHRVYQSDPYLVVNTDLVTMTPRQRSPKCTPGHCKTDTGCQVCVDD